MGLDKNFKPDHDFLFNGKNDAEVLSTDVKLASPLYYEAEKGKFLDVATKKYSRIDSNPSTPKAQRNEVAIGSSESKNSSIQNSSSGKKKRNKKNKKEKSNPKKNVHPIEAQDKS